MSSAQFDRLPHFIKKEMESISEQIRPLMRKVSTYYVFGFPLMLIGFLNIFLFIFNKEVYMDSLFIPIIYAFFTALGLALFNESRLLKKEIHQVGKDYIIERINKSKIMKDEEKHRYISSIKEQVKMDLQPFFRFLAEENKRNQNDFLK